MLGVLAVQSPAGKVAKRSLDILASTLGLIVLSPLFLLIAIAIKMDSHGPVLFSQERTGVQGKPFNILKFRTMSELAPSEGPEITVEGDARVTRIGGFLRSTKLDELAQLVNVLGGSMSLVGPRPEMPSFMEGLSRDELTIIRYKPGITDPASIGSRNEENLLAQVNDPVTYYTETLLPEKIRISLDYHERATFITDLGVIAQTLWSLVRPL